MNINNNPVPQNEREKVISKYWLQQGIEHSRMSPETSKLLDEKYVRRWAILIGFGLCFSLIGIIWNYSNQTNTELEVYKENIWETMSNTNKEIGGIKADVSSIKSDIGWLKGYFKESDTTINYVE